MELEILSILLIKVWSCSEFLEALIFISIELDSNELSKIVIGSKELPEKSIGRFYDNYNKLSAKNFKPILESNNDSLLAIQFDLSGELKDVVLWLAINEGDQNGLPEKYMRKNLAATLSKIANLSKDETEIFEIFVDNLINRK